MMRGMRGDSLVLKPNCLVSGLQRIVAPAQDEQMAAQVTKTLGKVRQSGARSKCNESEPAP